MPRTVLAAVASAAALLAGCGSSSKTPTAPPTTTPPAASSGTTTTTAMAHTGTAGTAGPAPSGTFKATNPTVLLHIDAALVKYFTAKGFAGVTANCRGASATTATCKVVGTNKAAQTSSAVLTIAVNQSTGLLRIVRVT